MKQIWSTGRVLAPAGATDSEQSGPGAIVAADAAGEGIPPTLAWALFGMVAVGFLSLSYRYFCEREMRV